MRKDAKPFLEKVMIPEDASWFMTRVPREPIPFEWHHHPEYELTLTTNSRGYRFIGDQVSTYDDEDLVLLGPNVPHTWASVGKVDDSKVHMVTVFQFRPEWARGLAELFPELRFIRAMLDRSARGIQFSPEIARRVRPIIEAIHRKEPADRLLDLLSILLLLAKDVDAEALLPSVRPPSTDDLGGSRIDRVLDHIHLHYRREITVEQLADLAALSPSAFHRMFKRQTRSTLSAYVIRLRIGEACAMLIAEEHSIASIAERVGYNSLANFGRQFKALKRRTPSEFRKQFVKRVPL